MSNIPITTTDSTIPCAYCASDTDDTSNVVKYMIDTAEITLEYETTEGKKFVAPISKEAYIHLNNIHPLATKALQDELRRGTPKEKLIKELETSLVPNNDYLEQICAIDSLLWLKSQGTIF